MTNKEIKLLEKIWLIGFLILFGWDIIRDILKIDLPQLPRLLRLSIGFISLSAGVAYLIIKKVKKN